MASLLQAVKAAPVGENWRLFVAVELPEEVRSAISDLRRRVPERAARTIRWVNPANVHITLKFLGDVEPPKALQVAEKLLEVAAQTGRMNLQAGGVGAFPNLRQPKILWVGFSGEVKRLEQLQGRLEGALGMLGFQEEPERFTAHATSGRVGRDARPDDISAIKFSWQRIVLPELPAISLEAITLFRSRLGAQPRDDLGGQGAAPVYERLFVARLAT